MRRILGVLVMLSLVLAARDVRADATKTVQKAIKAQVDGLLANDLSGFADDAKLTTNAFKGGVSDPATFQKAINTFCGDFAFVQGHKVKNLKVYTAGDADAWASFEVHLDMEKDEEGDAPLSFDFRVTEVLVKTGDAWKVIAGHWSRGVADKDANRLAKAGKYSFEMLGEVDSGDSELIEQIGGSLVKHEIHTLVSDRGDVVVYGTDKGKPRVGGKKTAKAWKAWFAATAMQDIVVTGVSADTNVGWLVGNVLAKKGKGAKAYQIPVRIFLALAREKAGWRVVAGQLSVPFDNYVY